VGLAARFPLRTRLTGLAAAGAALVLTVGALLLYAGLGAALSDAVTAELRVRAGDVAADPSTVPAISPSGGLMTQVVAADGAVIAPAGEEPLVTAAELERAGDGELVIDRRVETIGSNARTLIHPDEGADGVIQYVVVAGSTTSIARAREWLGLVLGVAGPLMVVAVAVTAWLLTGAALRPVRRMTRRAATISLREPDARLPEMSGRDEIAELSQTLNRMLGRIEATIAHERSFIDDASHELRTPIAVLRAELELARLQLDDDDDPVRTAAALESALEETDRLARLAEQLLVVARADAGRLVERPEPVELLDAARRGASRIRRDDLAVHVEGAEVSVFSDRLAIDQLLANLLSNAARWAAGRVQVDVRPDDGEALVRVADDGPGFGTDVLPRVFDRFGRGDPSRGRDGGGAGLGLAIVSAVVGAMGGRADVGNGEPLGGAWVEVRLPRR
jgi:signal transduction histidine kinase